MVLHRSEIQARHRAAHLGQDQRQHCELTADIARKFNNFYQTDLLKLPQFTIPQLGSKIMGLQNPEKKMSKSENDCLALLDKPEIIKKKIQRAETDSENKIYYDPEKKPGISNLLTIYSLLSDKKIKEVEKELNNCDYNYFKLQLIKLLNEKLGKIQKDYNHYLINIEKLLAKNNSYLQNLANQKIIRIKRALKIIN